MSVRGSWPDSAAEPVPRSCYHEFHNLGQIEEMRSEPDAVEHCTHANPSTECQEEYQGGRRVDCHSSAVATALTGRQTNLSRDLSSGGQKSR